MGLPIERLIVATNVNDILHRALSKGDYSVSAVTPTAAPSMDIQVSSNFERLLFDLEGRDGSTTGARMKWFEQMGKMVLSSDMRRKAALFHSARTDADEMTGAMRWAHDHAGQMIDPHTAIALHAARAAEIPADIPVVTLATAHPAKFREAVERATGIRPIMPARVGNLFDREERFIVLPAIMRQCAIMCWAMPLAPEFITLDQRAARGLYAARQRQWPQVGALWPLSLHPPRATGDVGTGAATDWQADAEFIPGSDEDGGGRWYYENKAANTGWPLAWEEVTLHRALHPLSPSGLFPRYGPGLALDAGRDWPGKHRARRQ